jgi:hypothetical protein
MEPTVCDVRLLPERQELDMIVQKTCPGLDSWWIRVFGKIMFPL